MRFNEYTKDDSQTLLAKAEQLADKLGYSKVTKEELDESLARRLWKISEKLDRILWDF